MFNDISFDSDANLVGARVPRARTHRHVNLCRLLVKIAAHPGVVDERLRRRLYLDVADDPAPAVLAAGDAAARGDGVIRTDHHERGLSWLHEICYLPFPCADTGIEKRHGVSVHIAPTAGAYAADLEPETAVLPIRRNRHILPVPARSRVEMAQVLFDGVGAEMRNTLPGLSNAARLPAAGDGDAVDGVRAGRGIPLVALSSPADAVLHLLQRPAGHRAVRTLDKLPFARERDVLLPLRPDRRVDHGRASRNACPYVAARDADLPLEGHEFVVCADAFFGVNRKHSRRSKYAGAEQFFAGPHFVRLIIQFLFVLYQIANPRQNLLNNF